MSIVLTSGSVKGADVVMGTVTRAVKLGIENGVIAALPAWTKTIAKKTGNMRRAVDYAVRQVLRESLSRSSSRIVISAGEIQQLVEAIVYYAQYHWEGGPFGSSYIQPFTPGTKPMSMYEFKQRAVPLIKQEITNAIRNEGVELSKFHSGGFSGVISNEGLGGGFAGVTGT